MDQCKKIVCVSNIGGAYHYLFYMFVAVQTYFDTMALCRAEGTHKEKISIYATESRVRPINTNGILCIVLILNNLYIFNHGLIVVVVILSYGSTHYDRLLKRYDINHIFVISLSCDHYLLPREVFLCDAFYTNIKNGDYSRLDKSIYYYTDFRPVAMDQFEIYVEFLRINNIKAAV